MNDISIQEVLVGVRQDECVFADMNRGVSWNVVRSKSLLLILRCLMLAKVMENQQELSGISIVNCKSSSPRHDIWFMSE